VGENYEEVNKMREFFEKWYCDDCKIEVEDEKHLYKIEYKLSSDYRYY